MLEIEIKARCADQDDVIEKIKTLKGIFIKEINEYDIYYNHPSKDFKETDEALRIRSADNKAILTYKGLKLSKETKTRIEQEAEFSEAESLKKILTSLGFTIAGEISKIRTTYKIDDIDICMDRVKDLGSFIELETKGEDKESGEKMLFDLAGKLGLKDFERRSYLELILDFSSDRIRQS